MIALWMVYVSYKRYIQLRREVSPQVRKRPNISKLSLIDLLRGLYQESYGIGIHFFAFQTLNFFRYFAQLIAAVSAPTYISCRINKSSSFCLLRIYTCTISALLILKRFFACSNRSFMSYIRFCTVSMPSSVPLYASIEELKSR